MSHFDKKQKQKKAKKASDNSFLTFNEKLGGNTCSLIHFTVTSEGHELKRKNRNTAEICFCRATKS